MEMQNYPEDYDGIWAACPAIYWNRFLLGGLWPTAVMNEYHHFLTAEKNRFFAKKVREAYGGDKTFYSLYGRPSFDACTLVGEKCKKGGITEKDAHVMNEIWAGPHRKDGTRLWYMQYPGSVNWQKGIPIGTYYYPLFSNRKVRAFSLGTTFARWIKGDSKADFSDIDIDGFEKLLMWPKSDSVTAPGTALTWMNLSKGAGN
ncbi:MAG: hypothetical protein IJV14_07730 [Lachnospiraceae bacterium]|nr:hypothetical protein [Lachnospiraceae bacterium]